MIQKILIENNCIVFIHDNGSSEIVGKEDVRYFLNPEKTTLVVTKEGGTPVYLDLQNCTINGTNDPKEIVRLLTNEAQINGSMVSGKSNLRVMPHQTISGTVTASKTAIIKAGAKEIVVSKFGRAGVKVKTSDGNYYYLKNSLDTYKIRAFEGMVLPETIITCLAKSTAHYHALY